MGRGYRLLSICFLLTSSFYLLISAISPPSNLRVVNLRSNTVTVSWTSPTEPTDSFSISISPLDDGESALPQFFNSSHATWDNLVSGKEYTVEVRSVVDGEDPSLPAVLIITTVPASPYNIQVSKFVNPLINQYRVTGSKTMMYPVYGAVVSWEMPDMGMLDDFVLTVDPPHGSVRVPIKLKSGISSEARTEQRRIVWELLPGVAYEFTVQTKSNGVLSNPITGKERMPPEIPGSITVEELKSTSVVISWEGNHRGILDGYAIETEPVGGIAVQISDDPLHQRRKVDNLIPGTTYDIEVYSTMDGLLSFKPSVIVINTPPATPRKEVKSEQITSESVFITWNPPPGQFEYYEIVYYPTDRDFGRLRERVWDARVNLTRLDPGSSYQVEIFSFGNDLFSEPLLETVYTRPLPPNKVKTTSTHDTIIMSWETVYFDGGAKIDYTIVGEENGTITKYLGPGITELSITELEPGSDYVINVFTVKNGVESDPVTVQTRTNPEPKAPPSDNIPVPPEAAATEKTVWTETTGTTAQTSTAAAATTTPAAIAGLVEETTAETENYKTTTTTAAAATTSQSTTTERIEKSTRKESKFTSVINTANPATQAAVGTPVATTASPIVTTTSVRGSAATEEQRSTTTNADATGTIRSQETTATYTTATNVTSETRAPTKSFDEDTTPTSRQFPAITKEAVTEQTTDNQREGKKSQSTTEAAKSQPSAITMSSTPTKATIDNTTASTADPAEPAARANQFTGAPSTIPSRSSSTTSETTTKSFAATTEATHATTNITIEYSEASRATTQEPETTYPPPFPDKENPGPPGDFKELNTTTSTTTKTTSKPSTTTHNTNYGMPHNSYSSEVHTERKNKHINVNAFAKKLESSYTPMNPFRKTSVPPDVTFEKFHQLDPIAKAGEIFFPNTVGIGSTIGPHFSLPNIIVGRTVKPFPKTQYYPWRTTTDPRRVIQQSTETLSTFTWPITVSSTDPTTTSRSTTKSPLFPFWTFTSTTTSTLKPQTTSAPPYSSFTLPRRPYTWIPTTRPAVESRLTRTSTQYPPVVPSWTSIKYPKPRSTSRKTVTSSLPTTESTYTPFTWRWTKQTIPTSSTTMRSQIPNEWWKTTTRATQPQPVRSTVTSSRQPSVYTIPTWLTQTPVTYRSTSTAASKATRYTTSSFKVLPTVLPSESTKPNRLTSWRTTKTSQPSFRSTYKSTKTTTPTVRTRTGNGDSSVTRKTTTDINNWTHLSTFLVPSTFAKTTTRPEVDVKALTPRLTPKYTSTKSTTNAPFYRVFQHTTTNAKTLKQTDSVLSTPQFTVTTSPPRPSSIPKSSTSTLFTLSSTSEPSPRRRTTDLWFSAIPTLSTATKSTNQRATLSSKMDTTSLPIYKVFTTAGIHNRSPVSTATSSSYTFEPTTGGQNRNATLTTTTTMNSAIFPLSSASSIAFTDLSTAPNTEIPVATVAESAKTVNHSIATGVDNNSSNNNKSTHTVPVKTTNVPLVIPEGRAFEITKRPEPRNIKTVETFPVMSTTQPVIESTLTSNHFNKPNNVTKIPHIEFLTTRSSVIKGQIQTTSGSSLNQNTSETISSPTQTEKTPDDSSMRYFESTASGIPQPTTVSFENSTNRGQAGTSSTQKMGVTHRLVMPSTTTLSITTASLLMTTSINESHPGKAVENMTAATPIMSEFSTIALSNITISFLKNVPATTTTAKETHFLSSTTDSTQSYSKTDQSTDHVHTTGTTTTATNGTLSPTSKIDVAEITTDSQVIFNTTSTLNELRTTDEVTGKLTMLPRFRSKLVTLPPSELGDLTTLIPKDTTIGNTTTAEETTTKQIDSNVTQYSYTSEPVTEEEIIIEHDRETITIRNGFKTICKPNNITVFVDKNVIGKYESEFGPLHFNKDDGQNCKGVEYDKYYRYTLAPNILGCGTQFTVNDTHVNFTNTVSNRRNHDSWYADMLDPSGHILIGGTNIKPYPLVHMNFYCTFPLEMTVHTDLIPDLRVEVKTFNVSGVGEFSAIMQLFKDKQYQHPHFAAPSLTPDQLLRVGVTLLKTKDEDISIAVRKCWATPVRLYDYDTFYPLIENYCPQDGALNNNLTILENGKSKRSRWEGPVFKFVKYTEVWLHCELKVCFGDSCNTTCSQLGSPRARRSLNPTRGAAIVSAGPVFVKREEKIEKQAPKPPVNTDAQDDLQETTVIIIVAVLCAVIFLMCVLFVLIMVKCRRNRRDKDTDAITCPESFATSTLGSRRGEDAYWDADGQYKVRSSPVHNPNAPASIDPNLPPVPCISASGEFPDSFAVVEDVPSILAPTPNCYSNPTFDSKSENR
ncbi:uncharacterized protein LOC120337462 isoform X1 [Styela clava]